MFRRRCIIAVICTAIIISVFSFSVSASASYPKAGKVITVSDNLNVRSSIGGNVIYTLPKNSYVTLISKTDGWYKVEYAAGKYGYSSANYISAVSSSYGATVKTSYGRLYVRSSAGGTIINSLASGTKVTVISENNGWSKIIYYGTSTGYVSSRYLSTESFTTVSLKVNSYKQTDSRWANKTIGSTKYTIGDIGCTTTALAMTESYRTGTTIYPDAMSKKLTYASSGMLYWPSNYSYTTDFTSYMQTIYNLLRQGKPVIIGAKKANGSQHWVVVTGISAVNELTPTAFKINDPGSSTRTNLGHFFTDYPYLHKIVWYN